MEKNTKKNKKIKPELEWFILLDESSISEDSGSCSVTTRGSLAEDLDIFSRHNKLDISDVRVYKLGNRVKVKLIAETEEVKDED